MADERPPCYYWRYLTRRRCRNDGPRKFVRTCTIGRHEPGWRVGVDWTGHVVPYDRRNGKSRSRRVVRTDRPDVFTICTVCFGHAIRSFRDSASNRKRRFTTYGHVVHTAHPNPCTPTDSESVRRNRPKSSRVEYVAAILRRTRACESSWNPFDP